LFSTAVIAKAALDFMKSPKFPAAGIIALGIGTALYDWYTASGLKKDQDTGQIMGAGETNPLLGGYEGTPEHQACEAKLAELDPSRTNPDYVCVYRKWSGCQGGAGVYGSIRASSWTNLTQNGCNAYSTYPLGYPPPEVEDEPKTDAEALQMLTGSMPDNPAPAVNQMVDNGHKPDTDQNQTTAKAPESVSIPESKQTTTNPDGSMTTTTEAIMNSTSGDGITSKRRITTMFTPASGPTTTTTTDSNTPSPAAQSTGTTTTSGDGTTTTAYPDGITVTRHPDGTITTTFPNGTTATRSPDVSTTTTYPDGTTVTKNPDGSTTTKAPDGTTTTTGDPCAANPESLGCLQLGSATPETIPTVQAPSTFSYTSWGVGACPAPVAVTTGVVFDYSQFCSMLASLRPIVVVVALLIAGFILMGPIKE
jgi:hypothetical protein